MQQPLTPHLSRQKILVLLTAALLLLMFFLGINKFPYQINQYSRTPDYDRLEILKTNQSTSQTFTLSGGTTISAFGIQIKSPLIAPDTLLHFTLHSPEGILLEQTHTARNILTTGKDANSIAPFDGFDGLDQPLQANNWLLFSFKPPTFSAEEITATITVISGQLELPIEMDATKYAAGARYRGDRLLKGNYGFVALSSTSWSAALYTYLVTHNGLRTVITIVLAALSISCLLDLQEYLTTKKSLRLSQVIKLLLVCTMLLTLPLFQTAELWGQGDWTEVVVHFSAARHAIAAGQFPLWNPYFCGGFPAWSNPQTYWPSLMFILTWFTGDVIGTKLAIVAYLFIASAGMYALGRRLQLAQPAALIAALIYTSNGFIIMHLGVGHLLWLTMAWIPWTIFFLLKSVKQPWYLVPTAISTLLIIIEGQIYFAVYTCILLALFALTWWWHTGERAIMSRLGSLAVLIAGLGAVKLLPTLYFTQTLGGHFIPGTFLPVQEIAAAFLQRGTTTIDPEHGAYIGMVALLLLLGGIYAAFRAKNKLYVSLTAITIIFLIVASLPAPLNPLQFLPILRDLRTPTRALVIVMFSISLLAAYGGNTLLISIRKPKIRNLMAVALFTYLAWNYSLVGRNSLRSLYSELPTAMPIATEFIQTEGRADTAYARTRAGQGSLKYCPPHLRLWQPEGSVIATTDPAYQGEVYTEQKSPAQITSFTPNKITIAVGEVAKPDVVHVNQNNDVGWQSREVVVSPEFTHLTFPITANNSNQTITIFYRPRGLAMGAIITGSTIVALSVLAVVQRRRAASKR